LYPNLADIRGLVTIFVLFVFEFGQGLGAVGATVTGGTQHTWRLFRQPIYGDLRRFPWGFHNEAAMGMMGFDGISPMPMDLMINEPI